LSLIIYSTPERIVPYNITAMNTIIIYRSKYGATGQYAEWLSADLGIPAIPQPQATSQLVAGAECIILGSSIYIGKLYMRKWIRQNAAALAGKRLFLFLVTATKSDKTEKLQGYVQHNIPLIVRRNFRCYFFPGKIIYNQLSLVDKLKVKTGGLLARLSHKKLDISDFNSVSRAHISRLVEDISAQNALAGGIKG